MAKKVTIYDIADKLNLSPSTVSRALSDNSLINIRTRDKVKKAAIELGYLDSPGQASESSVITIIVPELNNHFYSGVITSIQEFLGDEYTLSIMCSNNSAKTEKSLVSRLNPAQTRCLIISQSMDTTDCSHIEEAEKKGISIILFNRIYYNGTCPKVIMDDYMDSFALTNHLISTGRRRIAFAAKHFRCPIYRNRIQAYKDVLQKNNRTFYPEYLIYSELTVSDTHEIISRFIKMDPRPDAIILPSFTSALQAISIARLNGISVPHDIAIVSFDEDPECRYAIPSITAIEKPAKEIGEEIARTTIRICTGDIEGKESVRVFSSNLIIRGSSFSR